MFRFHRKGGEESEPKKRHPDARSGRAMLEAVKTGLDSQWFRSTRYSILKEFEETGQAHNHKSQI